MLFIGGSSAFQEPNPNKSSFSAEVVNVPSAGTPVNPASIAVPDGLSVTFRAVVANKSKDIYIANSALNCADAAKRITLHAGDAIAMFITDPNIVFVDASSNNAKVEVFSEV